MNFRYFLKYFLQCLLRSVAVLHLLLLAALILPTSLVAQSRLAVKVAPFAVNGPASQNYLGEAARDAVVGALIQKGWDAEALTKTISPEKLTNVRPGGRDTGLLVTGRLNVVGNQVRALLKWIDVSGQVGQAYVPASVENLLPELEKFASEKLPQPKLATTPQESKALTRSTWERAELPPPAPERAVKPVPTVAQPAPMPPPMPQPEVQAKAPAAPPPSQTTTTQSKELSSTRPVMWDKQGRAGKQPGLELRDYEYVSRRLPFEVRGMAYGDVTGNGRPEVLMTSQRTLYLYSFENNELKLLSEYQGSKLDYFVKVQVWQQAAQGPVVLLTVLREDRAASQILRYVGGRFVPVVKDSPYLLQAMARPGQASELLGTYYTPSRKTGTPSILPLRLQGGSLVKGERLRLPRNASLYNFVWVSVPGATEAGVVTLSSEGKLRLYKNEGGRYRKLWTSRGSYGGSGNYVPVKIKDFFNETVGDYFSVPVSLQTITQNGRPEIVVVKNTSLVKGVIGRVPLIADGQTFRLTWDAMGFVETWQSKKVDGSLQDLLVTPDSAKILGALKLRDPGLLGQIERNDSVMLRYDLQTAPPSDL